MSRARYETPRILSQWVRPFWISASVQTPRALHTIYRDTGDGGRGEPVACAASAVDALATARVLVAQL